jgi:hypothetical protein
MIDVAAQPAAPHTPKSPRWKRRLKHLALALAVLLLCVGFLLKDHVRTLQSLRRVPGTNAYVLDYFVDYNLAEIRAHGIDVHHVEDSFVKVFFPKWIAPIAVGLKGLFLKVPITAIPVGQHCSSVVLHTKAGHVYFGRNLDYSHDSCLILKVHGPHGIASVSVLDLHYLGLDRHDLDQTSLIQRIPLLFAP